MDLKLKDNSKLKLTPYTQLEYIESTGTQWIDTRIKLTEKISFDLEYKLNVVDQSKWFFGSATAHDGQGIFISNFGNGVFVVTGSQGKREYTIGGKDTNKHVIKYTPTLLSFDGNNISLSNNTFTSGTGCIAFGCYNGSTLDTQSQRIYALTFYNEYNVVLANFIPVYNGNVCLYDTVSERFFYNQGTGDFIAGPVVVPRGLPDNILLKTTTLYHKNTPNGLLLLESILNHQKTHQDVVLNRIRVDIGNTSGSLTELLKYAGMTGFNDAGEEQAKPRLVGTWTVNDWYTQEQLNQARSTFDGLIIIPNSDYLINFDDVAVQVLDSTKPNYNPAVGIAIESVGKGVTISNPIVNGGGRWFMTKVQAEAITNMGQLNYVFRTKTSFTDTHGIVTTDTTLSYDFNSFDEFQYFINITDGGGFSTCTKLESIVLHSNVTSIGGDGFYKCVSLRHINLPQSITSIGNGGLSQTGPTDLTDDELIDVNLPNLQTLGNGAFNGCKLIKSVTNLGTNITSMSGTFIDCINLKTINIPNTVTSLTNVFTRCYKLKMPDLPQSITYIGRECFLNIGRDITITDDDLKTLNLPNLTDLGDFACANNKFIKNVIDLGSFTTLGSASSRGCFEGCTNLISVNIPQTATSIGLRCFANCQNLSLIDMPQTITSIGSDAFSNCVKLKLTNIPTSITSIGKASFYNVGSSLTLTDNDLIEINLPNLTAISQQAFNGCRLIKEVISLGTITTVGGVNDTVSFAFEFCSNLTKATLPRTLNKIIERTFSQSNLSVIHLLNPVPATFTFTPKPGDYWDTLGQHSKIYVGDGSSAANDDSVLQAYLADTNWATYSSRLDTWYNYLHPTT